MHSLHVVVHITGRVISAEAIAQCSSSAINPGLIVYSRPTTNHGCKHTESTEKTEITVTENVPKQR